jgi:capsular exopolysaccharide synthesis family protein
MNIEQRRENHVSRGEVSSPRRSFVAVGDLRRQLSILNQRKYVILVTIALVMLLTSVFLVFAKRYYTAELQIMFDGPARPMFDLRSSIGDQLRSESELFNQIVLLRSRGLARRVIDKLNLHRDPELNPELRPPGPLRSLAEILPASLRRAEQPENNEELIIDGFLRRLEARNVPRARAIELTYVSASPETAAAVLNALGDAYVQAKLDHQFESVRRGSVWLAERIQTLRAEVENSENAVEQYRKRNNLFHTEGNMLLAKQITDLNIKLTDARIDRAAAEANVAAARRLLSASDSEGATAVQVLQSETIGRFREQELELERRSAEMQQTFGARHPAMTQLEAQREELRKKLRDEIQRILKSLDNQARVAQMRETELSKDLEQLKLRQEEANKALVGLRTLERTAEANRLMLQRMMSSFLEAKAQSDLDAQVPEVRVVSPAAIPIRPSSPRPMILVPVAFLFATVLGVLLAFALDQWDTGFRSADQAEEATGLPVLTHVPLVRRVARNGLALREHPASAFAEAVRTLYTRLLLLKEKKPQILLIISAQAEEGKTTLCAALGRQQALAGQRTIVIDADFRRSSLAHTVGVQPAPGLSEVLTGSCSLSDAMQQDPQSPACFLAAGQQWVDAATLGSRRAHEIIQELRTSFDLIVIDSAPVSVISDTLVLAKYADAIVMTVRWAWTPQGLIRSALNQLNHAGVQPAGLVLSMVDVKKLPRYEYADYRKHAKYYAT